MNNKSKNKGTIQKPVIKTKSNTIVLPAVLGGPPDSGSNLKSTENLRKNSRLIIDITPCKTKAEQGISLFRLERCWSDYINLLKDVGFSPSQEQNSKQYIRIATQAENFPTDTFNNEYGEHFLNKITDVAGSAMGETAQMMGQKTATGALKELGGLFESIGNNKGGGMIESGIGGLGKGISGIGSSLERIKDNMSKQQGVAGTIGKTMDALLAGARIDFPMVWKNSSYSPTFSCSIKLYNPDPASKESTQKYIIGPLAAILTLALPQSNLENSYTWPFFCQVNCPGLFKIAAGAISNVSVTKGGDAGLIAYNQRSAMVDVRIDFINLHSSIILSSTGYDTRPTLKGYLKNMTDSIEIKPLYNVEEITKEPTPDQSQSPLNSALQAAGYNDPTSPAPSRIDEELLNIESNLLINNPLITPH